jgi:hypothetical protein
VQETHLQNTQFINVEIKSLKVSACTQTLNIIHKQTIAFIIISNIIAQLRTKKSKGLVIIIAKIKYIKKQTIILASEKITINSIILKKIIITGSKVTKTTIKR